MAQSICAGYAFNSGVSPCPLDPGKIKGLILYTDDNAVGVDLSSPMSTEAGLTSRFYAARPNRLFPIGGIVNYESSGGEVQTSQVGYGASRITGYSEKQMTFTIDHYDFNLRAAIANARGTKFKVLFVDDNNVVYGLAADSGTYDLGLKGVQVDDIAVGGQDFATADTTANLAVTLYINDYEEVLKSLSAVKLDYDVADALQGLVFVDVAFRSGSPNDIVLVAIKEHYSGHNISAAVSGMVNTQNVLSVFTNNGSSTAVNSVTYDSDADAISIKSGLTTSDFTGLADANTLYNNGVFGIEGW
ncbi:MAG: hypothetical protein IKO20_04115 [Bacteroidaceae bacterium]|nr:hypothetical protein [Bacteroidaceae bacterium]